MNRRALLSTLTGSTLLFAAGCLSNGADSSDSTDEQSSDSADEQDTDSTDEQDTDSTDEQNSVSPTETCDVEITTASVSVEYGCDAGELRSGGIRGRASDCDVDLTVGLVEDGTTGPERDIEPTDGQWSIGFGEGPNQFRGIPGPGDKTVQVRDPDGDVLAEDTLSVSHYLDEPNLDVWNPSFEPDTVAIGDPVTVRFSIATFGAETSYTASLLVDGERVETREGTVEGGADCMTASGPEYEFTPTFERPGEYDLAGQITIDESGGGDRRSIGTVTVTE